MFKLIVLMILLIFTYSLVNGFSGDGTSFASIGKLGSVTDFHEVGYFKDESKNHILTVRIPVTATKGQVEQYAKDQTKNAGHSASLYFFEDGSMIPVNGIMQAESLPAVNELLYNTDGINKWRFAFMRKPNGSTRMVDCSKYPESDLCRT
ncbi:MAG: hypothetical protein OES90_08025 [Xanthomonadales bacterium]|nr:hypothetical protein [Xanthomonadales bacterium]